MTTEPQGLRERKKQATRRRIVESAYALFERDGFESTTVDAVARDADISQATFFNHFPTKEDLLFPDRDQIRQAALAAIASSSGEGHVETIARAVRAMIDTTVGGLRDPSTELESRRIRLVMAVPQLRARMLQNAFDLIGDLTAALRRAHPEVASDSEFVTILGAIFGAALAAGTAGVQRGDASAPALESAVDYTARAFRSLQ